MAWTRYQLEQQIADDLDRADLTNQISNAVETAIRSYRFERLPFNEAYKVTATLTASEISIALADLPTRFRKIDRIRLKRNAIDNMQLDRRDYEWIMDRQDYVVTSLPTEYAVYNNTIYFDCPADQTYTIFIDGIRELGSSSASYSTSDTSAWFNDARELVRHRAKAEIYAHVLKDMELASAAKAAERDALNTLKGEANEMNATGFIVPTEF